MTDGKIAVVEILKHSQGGKDVVAVVIGKEILIGWQQDDASSAEAKPLCQRINAALAPLIAKAREDALEDAAKVIESQIHSEEHRSNEWLKFAAGLVRALAQKKDGKGEDYLEENLRELGFLPGY